MARRFDRHEATSTARIERVQRRVDQASAPGSAAPEEPTESYGLSERELSELHITTGDESLPDDVTAHVAVVADDMVDGLAEAFNARDLDGVLELCTADCEIPGLASDMAGVGPALDDLWVRRPSITMTRVVVDDHAVGVLWERLAQDRWGTVGTVHLDVVDDMVGVMEFSEDQDVIDRRHPPSPEVDDPIWQDPDEEPTA